MSDLLHSVTAALPGLRPRVAPEPWYADQILRRDRWIPEEIRLRQTKPGMKRLLILHSPKTGGSSLRRMFQKHVPANRTMLATGQHEWMQHSAQGTRDIQLFVGHQFLEPLYRYPEDPWVTVLPAREPLSWWRSWYKYRRGLLHAARDFTDPLTVLTMSEWVDSRRDVELSNPQASWLLTRTRVMFDSVVASPGAMASSGASLWESPAQAVELLGRLIGAVTVLGGTEDLMGIYRRTCKAMGWEPLYTTAVRENTSSQAPELLELRPDQTERLLRINKIDSWLYAHAVREAGTAG